MNFRKRTIGSDTFGIIPYVVAAPMVIGLFISSLCLNSWVLAGFASFALLIVLASYKPFSRIIYSPTAITEKGILYTRNMSTADIRQIGLLVVFPRDNAFLKEENIKLTSHHIEIYVTNYQTVNPPTITDTGTVIKFDYREEAWEAF